MQCTWKGCEFGLQSREALGAPPDPLVSAGMLACRVTVLSVLGGRGLDITYQLDCPFVLDSPNRL